MTTMLLPILLACSPELAIPISQSTIQAVVEEKFPLKGGAEGLASLSLTNPVVILPGEDRIAMTLDATAAWKDIPVRELAAEGMENFPKATSTGEAATQALNLLESAIQRTRSAEMFSRRGVASIEGTLAYEDGSFYLYQTELTRLEIAGLGPEQTEQARLSAQVPLAAALDRLPVFTLDADHKQKAASFIIRQVKTSDGELQIVLGLPK
jgi:hypothetical protein